VVRHGEAASANQKAFRNILKCRKKQITLDKFFVRQRPSESQAGSKDRKEKKNKPQEDSYLMFLWKGAPLSNNN
jgi:hypothetical protein